MVSEARLAVTFITKTVQRHFYITVLDNLYSNKVHTKKENVTEF